MKVSEDNLYRGHFAIRKGFFSMTISTKNLALSRLAQSRFPSPRLMYGQKVTDSSYFCCWVNMIKVKCSEIFVVAAQRAAAPLVPIRQTR